ncbi:MAG: AbrB family transcriptional regulator [Pseudomonadota bacterium]
MTEKDEAGTQNPGESDDPARRRPDYTMPQGSAGTALPARIRLAGSEHEPLALLATIAIGIVGAGIAHLVALPLPWLSGSLLAVAGVATAGIRVRGGTVTFPLKLRFAFVPIIGVAIGGAFTPDLIAEAPGWWITLLALALFLPLAHLIGFLIYRNGFGYDRETSFFAAMPGGLIEAVDMGERAGADSRLLTLLQFSRLILCILLVPLGITLYEGVAVGSASGIAFGEGEPPLGLVDAVVLIAAGAAGLYGARWLGMPAAIITGPILASGAVHLAGLTEADPPGFLVSLTQLVVGTSLGVRFTGFPRAELLRGMLGAGLSVGTALALALATGLVLAAAVGEDAEAVVLAFAPGGVVEMSLVALSLQLSVVFVSAHHVARILICVFMARYAHRWLVKHRGWNG